MTQRDVMEKFRTLPPEAQRQVLDFMASLSEQYQPAERSGPKCKLSEEKFIGIWRERADLGDSIGWVRDVRRTEWGNVG